MECLWSLLIDNICNVRGRARKKAAPSNDNPTKRPSLFVSLSTFPELHPFLCAEGWEDRLVGAIDDWVTRKMAVWIEKPQLFSIITTCDQADEIKRDNNKMDMVSAIQAAGIIATTCHLSTDDETYPVVRFIVPQMEFCRQYATLEIDAGRNIETWTNVLCGLGL